MFTAVQSLKAVFVYFTRNQSRAECLYYNYTFSAHWDCDAVRPRTYQKIKQYVAVLVLQDRRWVRLIAIGLTPHHAHRNIAVNAL